jgi:pimeloyl-ACP methyl ester carboxylesterase
VARLPGVHVLSEEKLAPVNGIELAYQETGEEAGEPLLLVMGLATQMLGWDEGFCSMLAEHGFRVVRFDNRDIGRSTKIDSAGLPKRADTVFGRRSTAPYFLTDMAADTAGLMDHLGIESAHVVGASMGGMIAQTLAIHHPERVRSMVSIMSTTGNRRLGFPTWGAFRVLLASPARGREAAIEQAVKTFRVIGSPRYPMDERRLREVVGASYDRDHRRAGVARQLHAISASGDRTPALRGVRVPTTVIHGASDPLVRPAGGRATAKAIPGARLKMIEGMGHDLPRELWPTFIDEIAANAARASEDAAQKQPA